MAPQTNKAINPASAHKNSYITQLYLQGLNQTEIAKKVGIDQSQVSRRLNNDDCKEMIETGMSDMCAMIPKAMQNFNKSLDSDDEAIRIKVSEIVCKNTGIAPSHTTNTFIQNIYNSTTNQTLNVRPEVLGALQNALMPGVKPINQTEEPSQSGTISTPSEDQR